MAVHVAYRTGKAAGAAELFADRPAAMRFRILLDDDAWKPMLEHAMA